MLREDHSSKMFSDVSDLGRRLQLARGRLEEALSKAEVMPITWSAPEVLDAERDIQILETSLLFGYGVRSFPAGSAEA